MSLSKVRYLPIRHCQFRMEVLSKCSTPVACRQLTTSSCKNAGNIKSMVKKAYVAFADKVQELDNDPTKMVGRNKVLMMSWMLVTATISLLTTHFLKKHRRDTLIDLIYEKQFGDKDNKHFEKCKWQMVWNELRKRAKNRYMNKHPQEKEQEDRDRKLAIKKTLQQKTVKLLGNNKFRESVQSHAPKREMIE